MNVFSQTLVTQNALTALHDLIIPHDNWLKSRFLHYTQQQGYADLSASESDSEGLFTELLSQSFLKAIEFYQNQHFCREIRFDLASFANCNRKIALELVQYHHSQQNPFSLLFGLLKCYRQAYLDLLNLGKLDEQCLSYMIHFVNNIFDQIELGCCEEWTDITENDKMQELKKENRQLSREKENYFASFIHSNNAVFLFDAHDHLINLNPTAAKIFTNPNFAEALTKRKKLPHVDLPWLYQQIHQFSQSRQREKTCQLFLNTNAGMKWFEVQINYTFGIKAKLSGKIVICRDITATIESEEQLYKSQRSLAEAQHIGHIGNWYWNLTSGEVYWSDEIYRIFGYQPQTFPPSYQQFLKQVHPDDRQRILKLFKQNLSQNTQYSLDHRLILPDGSVCWVHQEAIAKLDHRGNLLKLAGTIQDVSTWKEIEQSLRIKDFALESAIGAIAIWNLKGDLTYGNPVFCQLWGYSNPQAVLGLPFFSFWQDSDNAIEIFKVLQEQGQWIGELIAKKPDESLFYVQVHANLVKDDQGIPLCLMASVVDMTEHKQILRSLQQSEDRLKTIITTDVNGLVVVDKCGKVLFINPAAEQLFGRGADNFIGNDFGLPLVINESTEIEIPQRNGDIKIAAMRVVTLPWQQNTAYLVSLTDITEIKRAEEKIRILWQATEQSPASIIITDNQGNIEYVNPKFEEVTGYKAHEVLGKNPRLLKSDYTTPTEYQMLWKTITAGHEWRGEFHNKKKNGEYFWESASISPMKNYEGEITHFVAVKEDITARKENEERLNHQANYDPLTHLPNRFLVFDRLQQAIMQANRNHKRIAVMFLDLDHFKNINDTLGHEIGDQLLIHTAQRLQSCLRKSDTVARLGGDEFLIILPDLEDYQQSETIAQKILTILEPPFELATEEIFVSTSIGITIYPDDGTDTDILLRNADTAMYGAKHEGRNGFKFFTSEMNDVAQKRRKIENHLRYALKRNELYVVYQPLIEVASGKVVGAEALMRWYNLDLGQVPPDQFIPIAEETGIINEIGAWILAQACQEATKWQQTNDEIWVAINLSPRQFREANFVEIITQTLVNSGIPTHCLELEITERLLVEDIPGAKDMIAQLSQRSIRLSLDDFGTGYSSLSYLKKFPFDILKIDRSFIADVPQDADDVSLVKTIIAMAHGLNLKVIAEGVETQEQFEFLAQQGCDFAQGYWLSKPLLSADFQQVLQESRKINQKPAF